MKCFIYMFLLALSIMNSYCYLLWSMLLRSTSCIYCQMKRFQWYDPWLLPLFHSLSFYSIIFPTGALFLTTLALLFLKQIPFLPCPKTLQLLFFWKCSSPRPAWLATSPVWASPMLFKSHNETLNPFPFLLLLKDTLSLYPLNSPA